MKKKLVFYKRDVLCTNGSIFEGRWSSSKEAFMTSVRNFVSNNVKALGPWQECEIDSDYFDAFFDEDELT